MTKPSDGLTDTKTEISELGPWPVPDPAPSLKRRILEDHARFFDKRAKPSPFQNRFPVLLQASPYWPFGAAVLGACLLLTVVVINDQNRPLEPIEESIAEIEFLTGV